MENDWQLLDDGGEVEITDSTRNFGQQYPVEIENVAKHAQQFGQAVELVASVVDGVVVVLEF